ncbi:hypothetical protein COT72_00790 [archaeon CG10_big_fil_rev_8_21_14_0_10_43_11]|nr:MAG: hypothetical protein COT72_00790 [archaeon CG10_big_fil_rev_8_21_14_0_10_43_11]
MEWAVRVVKKYGDIGLVFLIALFSRSLMLFFYPYVQWDAAVYLLNAQYFLGGGGYFEEFRPPLLAALISVVFGGFGVNESLARIIPVLFSALFITLVYVVSKEWFGKKVGLFATVLTLFNPYHFEWSPRFYTGIMSSALAMLGVLFLRRGLFAKTKNTALAFIFAALAALARYVYLALLPLFVFVQFVSHKPWTKKGLKKSLSDTRIYSSIMLWILIMSPWLIFNAVEYGNMFHSFERGHAIIAGNEYDTEVTYYVMYGVVMFSLLYGIGLFAIPYVLGVFLLVLLSSVVTLKQPVLKKLVKRYKNQAWVLLILSGYFIGYVVYFHAVLRHKEIRYLWPLFFPIVIMGSILLRDVSEWFSQIRFSYWLIGLSVVCGLILFSTFVPRMAGLQAMCGMEPIVEASHFVGEQGGAVMSPFWPLVAYYGDITETWWMSWEHEFDSDIRLKNISFVFGTSQVIEPDYVRNQSFFDARDYLHKVATFSDTCQTVWVYRVA